MLIRPAILAIASLLTTQGATRYVDFVGGNDANDGASDVTAFKHCPGDAQATGNAASTTLAPGDITIFKGGITHLLQSIGTTGISIGVSGSPGNPITFDGNSAGTFGTGKAIISDANASVGHNAFFSSAGRSNLLFKNILFSKLGGSPSLPTDLGSAVPANPGRGISLGSSTVDIQDITVQDCDFSELGYWYNQKPIGAASIDGSGVQFFNGKRILLQRCNFSRVAIGVNNLVSSRRTDGVIYDTCTFTDSVMWCMNISTIENSSWLDNITIKDCAIYNYQQFDGANWQGYGGQPHTDGLFLRNDYSYLTCGTNNNVRRNSFYQTVAPGSSTASIYITEGMSANVYNNKFYYQGKSRNMSIAGGPITNGGLASPQRIVIANNSCVTSFTLFLDWGAGTGASSSPFGGGSGVASGTGSYLVVLNNILYDTFQTSGANFLTQCVSPSGGTVGNMLFDYNLYMTFNFGADVAQWTGVYGDASVAELRSRQGFELHGLQADPLFVNLVTTPANLLTADLNLQSGSPARGAGTNLTALVPFLPELDVGFNGKVQPSVGMWDMGAFPYNPTTNRPPIVIGGGSLKGAVNLKVH